MSNTINLVIIAIFVVAGYFELLAIREGRKTSRGERGIRYAAFICAGLAVVVGVTRVLNA